MLSRLSHRVLSRGFHTLRQIEKFGKERRQHKKNPVVKKNPFLTKEEKEGLFQVAKSSKFDNKNTTQFNYKNEWYWVKLEKHNSQYNNLDKLFIFSKDGQSYYQCGKIGDFVFELPKSSHDY